jgi:hypothetical protein
VTNKIVLRDIDQLMADFVPTYTAVMPTMLGNSQGYSEEVGTLTFKRLEAVGDLRTAVYLPKDTEIKQISVTERSKVFKKYFLANQFVQSALQDLKQVEDVVRQVLDEHFRQIDDLWLYGAGTSASTVINNGLYWSADPNYILESSSALASTDGHLPALHAKIIDAKTKADKVAGSKILIMYGSTTRQKFNALYPASSKPFKTALQEVLGPQYRMMELPEDVTLSSAEGFMVVNEAQVKTHYTALPALKAQGVNEEKMYIWHNFLMGSTMVEVLAKGGIIRQPVTYL